MNKTLKNTFTVMAGTLSSRLLGLVRQQVYVAFFPAALRDAFDVATRVPNLFREILAEGAVQNALIPVLGRLEGEDSKDFQQKFGGLLLGFNALIVGLLWLLARPIADLLVAGNSHLRQPEEFERLVYLIRLASPFLLMISVASLFSAIQQSKEKFGNSFAPVAFNIGSILVMAIFQGNAVALGVSFVVGGLLQALVQVPGLKGFRFSFGKHAALSLALGLMAPFMFTTGLRQVLNLVLVKVLTHYPSGATNAFYNAEVIYLMALGLLATSPAMAVYPRMVRLHSDHAGLRSMMKSFLAQVTVLLGIATALLAGLSPWLSGVYAFSDNFTPENRAYCTAALSALGLSLLPWGINVFLLRMFYALGAMRQAVQISAVVLVVNSLGYWFLRLEGMFLLNLSTVFAGILGTVLYANRLSSLGVLDSRNLYLLLAKVVLASVPAGVCAWWVASKFGIPVYALHNILPILAGGLVGLAVFVIGAVLLKLPIRRGR